MNSVTTRGCRISHAGAPPRPLEKRAARPRDARRTTPAWLFDTQTQFFFSNAKLSTKSGQAQSGAAQTRRTRPIVESH